MDKVFYNEGSAAKLGWSPDWFGASEFDEDLIKKIRISPRPIRDRRPDRPGPDRTGQDRTGQDKTNGLEAA